MMVEITFSPHPDTSYSSLLYFCNVSLQVLPQNHLLPTYYLRIPLLHIFEKHTYATLPLGV